ncbi:MAG: carbohydrate binding domain-containing protein [Ruminococcus flavefaciens]|nr:carbohydrate binding domain-containing protein [Ruminococcus flavefaciens]MCM1062274.1 carbohydrate binding domain-containing protein [Eubacterium sp.]
MEKLIALFATVTIAASSFVSCASESGTSKKEKDKAASTKEEAVENYYEAVSSGNIDKIFSAMVPQQYLDYCVTETGLPEDKLFYRLGRIRSDDHFDVVISNHKKIYLNLDGFKVGDSWLGEEGDDAYTSFNQSIHNAGIKSSIDRIYDIDAPSGIDVAYENMSEEQKKAEQERLQTPGIDIYDDFLYLLDGKWYYGPESIMEYLIMVGLEGYSALPEEVKNYDDNARNYYYEKETLPDVNNYESSGDTEHNSQSEPKSVNLCADSSNWASWSSDEYDCASTMKLLSDGAALEVTKTANGYYYYNQLAYDNLILEKNATYRLEFDYEASEDVEFEFAVQQNYEPYSWYINDIIDVSSNGSNHYSRNFTMLVTDDNANIVFNCNDPRTETPYTFTIKNLTLVRVD